MKPFYYRQNFSVDFNFPVVFTSDIFNKDNQVLLNCVLKQNKNIRNKVIVFVDNYVAESEPLLLKKINNYFKTYKKYFDLVNPPLVIPGGEKIKKNYKIIKQIITNAKKQDLCRQSYFIVIGGGAVLDTVGFAGTLFHRGIRLIRIPTTTLSQCDSGVGVKYAMNYLKIKNLIGTFSPPYAILIDSKFLSTLNQENWISGISEAFKVALIRDKNFFSFLCENAIELKKRNEDIMHRVIKKCAILHLKHIRQSGDPFEFGQAKPLDFGHWAAHKLESLSNYDIGHGHAVAVGIAIDSYYAMQKKWIQKRDFDFIIKGLLNCGFSLWYNLLEKRNSSGSLLLMEGLEEFRQHLGGTLCLTFPNKIGHMQNIHKIDIKIMESAIMYLKGINNVTRTFK